MFHREKGCQRYLETKLQSINFLLKQFNLQSNGISGKAKVRRMKTKLK